MVQSSGAIGSRFHGAVGLLHALGLGRWLQPTSRNLKRRTIPALLARMNRWFGESPVRVSVRSSRACAASYTILPRWAPGSPRGHVRLEGAASLCYARGMRRTGRAGSAVVVAIAFGLLAGGACALQDGGILTPGSDGAPLPDVALDSAPESDAQPPDTGPVDSSVPDSADAAVVPPSALPNLELWFKADVGVIFDDAGTGVVGWTDQSGKNDPLRNAALPPKFGAPTVISAPFGPAVYFDTLQGLQTGQWAGGITEPLTVFVVAGKDPQSAVPAYLFDSLTQKAQLAVLTGVDHRLYPFCGAYGTAAAGLVTKPMSVIGVYNAASTFLLLNSNHGDAGASSPGPNGFAAGFTLGNFDPGVYGFNGYIAEFAVYSRVLTDPEIASLNAYAAKRYGVAIQ